MIPAEKPRAELTARSLTFLNEIPRENRLTRYFVFAVSCVMIWAEQEVKREDNAMEKRHKDDIGKADIPKDLTVKDLEQRIAGFHYAGEGLIRDRDVENACLPVMVKTFYSYVTEHGTVPAPEEFVESYLSGEYFEKLPESQYRVTWDGETKELSADGLRARLLRAYPSFLRDFHFRLMALESGLFEEVAYTEEEDYYGGVDVTLRYGGRQFAIGLFAGTRRAGRYSKWKLQRHPDAPEILKLELRPEVKKHCGDIDLYTPVVLQEVLEFIQQEIAVLPPEEKK